MKGGETPAEARAAARKILDRGSLEDRVRKGYDMDIASTSYLSGLMAKAQEAGDVASFQKISKLVAQMMKGQ